MVIARKDTFELIYEEPTSKTLVNPLMKKMQHRINFATAANKFSIESLGFGVERVDITRGTRKTVQQTMGNIKDTTVEDNYYVDTWWTSPPKIIIAGVVEMPAGKSDTVAVGLIMDDTTTTLDPNKSLLGTLEKMFEKNNHPYSVRNGDTLTFVDYYMQQSYRVTLKNYNTSISIDKPNLMTFSLEMDVLQELSSTGKDSPQKTGGTLNLDSVRDYFANQLGLA